MDSRLISTLKTSVNGVDVGQSEEALNGSRLGVMASMRRVIPPPPRETPLIEWDGTRLSVRLFAEAASGQQKVTVEPSTALRRRLGRTARQAVGYREALSYLAGEYDHDEMARRITYRTRRFAKRQGTWFRSLSECRFVDITGEVVADAVAARIAGAAR